MAFIYTSCNPIALNCFLYTDSGLTNPVANGYYHDGTNGWQVTGGAGQVTSAESCTERQLFIYARQNPDDTPAPNGVALHYSFDDGATWEISNITVNSTICGLLNNSSIRVANGSNIQIRFGDTTNVSIVYPAVRVDADTNCPAWSTPSSTCAGQSFLLNQDRTAAFTIDSNVSCNPPTPSASPSPTPTPTPSTTPIPTGTPAPTPNPTATTTPSPTATSGNPELNFTQASGNEACAFGGSTTTTTYTYGGTATLCGCTSITVGALFGQPAGTWFVSDGNNYREFSKAGATSTTITAVASCVLC